MLEYLSCRVFRGVIQNASWNLRGYEKAVTVGTRGSKNQGPMSVAHKGCIECCEHLFSAACGLSRNLGQRITHAEHGQRHECSCTPASAEVASSRQRAPVIAQPMHSYQSLPGCGGSPKLYSGASRKRSQSIGKFSSTSRWEAYASIIRRLRSRSAFDSSKHNSEVGSKFRNSPVTHRPSRAW